MSKRKYFRMSCKGKAAKYYRGNVGAQYGSPES